LGGWGSTKDYLNFFMILNSDFCDFWNKISCLKTKLSFTSKLEWIRSNLTKNFRNLGIEFNRNRQFQVQIHFFKIQLTLVQKSSYSSKKQSKKIFFSNNDVFRSKWEFRTISGLNSTKLIKLQLNFLYAGRGFETPFTSITFFHE
jgi:hypothetical protein